MVCCNGPPWKGPATSLPFLYKVADGMGTPLALQDKLRLSPSLIGSTSSKVTEGGSVKKHTRHLVIHIVVTLVYIYTLSIAHQYVFLVNQG